MGESKALCKYQQQSSYEGPISTTPIFNRKLPYVKTNKKQNTTTAKLELKALRLYCVLVYKSFQMAGRKFTLQVDALWRLINTYSFHKAIISTDLFNAAIYEETFISFLEMADLEHLVYAVTEEHMD